MKTSTLKKSARSTDQTRKQITEDYWAEAVRISELRYRRLFETAQDGILILDANSGEIMDVNPFLIDLLDYPFEELRGRKLWEIGQFKDIAANRAAFETLQQNEYIRYENLPLRRRDGKQIQVEFVSNVYWLEADKVIQCNIRDITARAEMRNDSDTHLAALELANGTKDAWLIAHSQNLRTPLMSMGSMLDLMGLGQKLACVRPLYEEPSDFDEAAFRHVRENFQRLVNFFNELADLTGQSPLQLEGSPPLGTEPSVATFINHDWRGLDSPEGEYPRLENKDYDHN
jgi:PAS domain S-box-containing protein